MSSLYNHNRFFYLFYRETVQKHGLPWRLLWMFGADVRQLLFSCLVVIHSLIAFPMLL